MRSKTFMVDKGFCSINLDLQHLLPHKEVIGAILASCHFTHGVCSIRSEVLIAVASRYNEHKVRAGLASLSITVLDYALRRTCNVNLNCREETHVTSVALRDS